MSERPIRTFADCLYECSGTPDFVAVFNRLTGCHLTPQSAPDSPEVLAFAAFVDAYIWQPILAEAAEDD